MPAHRKTCLKRLSELTSLPRSPPCVFSRSGGGPCTITAGLAEAPSSMHVDPRVVGAVVVPVGLAFVVIRECRQKSINVPRN